VAIGQGKYPEVPEMMGLLAQQVGGLLAFDASTRARQAGSPLAVNMVLLGALVAADYLPFPSAGLVDLIRTRTNPKFLEANLQAFQMGQDAARDAANWLKKLKD
jgi:indolepyruvate ferredoxin oxidoreductase beta subunit